MPVKTLPIHTRTFLDNSIDFDRLCIYVTLPNRNGFIDFDIDLVKYYFDRPSAYITPAYLPTLNSTLEITLIHPSYLRQLPVEREGAVTDRVCVRLSDQTGMSGSLGREGERLRVVGGLVSRK